MMIPVVYYYLNKPQADTKAAKCKYKVLKY